MCVAGRFSTVLGRVGRPRDEDDNHSGRTGIEQPTAATSQGIILSPLSSPGHAVGCNNNTPFAKDNCYSRTSSISTCVHQWCCTELGIIACSDAGNHAVPWDRFASRAPVSPPQHDGSRGCRRPTWPIHTRSGRQPALGETLHRGVFYF